MFFKLDKIYRPWRDLDQFEGITFPFDYGGRRIYQSNEDDFSFKLYLIVNKFFRITSLQVINEKLFKLTAFLCFHVFVNLSMLFKSLISIKIEIKSRLHYIDIIAYHRIIHSFPGGRSVKIYFI